MVTLSAAQTDYIKKRREKRWMVLEDGISSGWAIILETGSFQEAKDQYLALVMTIPADRLLLVRTVDPWVGLYPVN
jgi:hypothetical protein